MLVGAGAAEGAVDAANILKPSLARGELQAIGATTLDEYRKYIERDAALERRFQPVLVEEPTSKRRSRSSRASRALRGAPPADITDDALKAAAELAARYVSDRFLPGQGHRPDRRGRLAGCASSAPPPPTPSRRRCAPGQRDEGKGAGHRRPAVRAGRRAARPRAQAAGASIERLEPGFRRQSTACAQPAGDRGGHRPGRGHVDRDPGHPHRRGGIRAPAADGGRPARARRRPGRGRRGRRQGRPPRPRRPEGPQAPHRRLHLPRPHRGRQDRAGRKRWPSSCSAPRTP